jgi:hypothetical protein
MSKSRETPKSGVQQVLICPKIDRWSDPGVCSVRDHSAPGSGETALLVGLLDRNW